MSGGRERIAPEVVKAVEEDALHNILAKSHKELTAKHRISTASLYRIIRAARQRLQRASMTDLSQSQK